MKIKNLLVLLMLMAPLNGQEIVMWHAFEGFVYEKFAEIVSDFNHQSGHYQIKPVYAGNYTETFNKGIEAFEKGAGSPHLANLRGSNSDNDVETEGVLSR